MNEQPSTITVTLDVSPDQADPKVRDALQGQGFGILSEIDVQAAMAEKLGHEMGVYTILGACNPPLAKRAIEADPDIGAFLPCNVLLRANEAGGTDVVAADPLAMLAVSHAGLREVAEEARDRLVQALESL